MHISEKGQTALTLADGLGDIGISSVYQRDTLTVSYTKWLWATNVIIHSLIFLLVAWRCIHVSSFRKCAEKILDLPASSQAAVVNFHLNLARAPQDQQ